MSNITRKHCTNIFDMSSNISQICYHAVCFGQVYACVDLTWHNSKEASSADFVFVPLCQLHSFQSRWNLNWFLKNLASWNYIQYFVWCIFVKYWTELQFHILQVEWHALYRITPNQGWYCNSTINISMFDEEYLNILRWLWNRCEILCEILQMSSDSKVYLDIFVKKR